MKHEPGFYLTPRAIRYLRARPQQHTPPARPTAAPATFPYRHKSLGQLPDMGRPQ